MPDFNFTACSIPTHLEFHIHFTKSPKRDNIYKYCVYVSKESGTMVLGTHEPGTVVELLVVRFSLVFRSVTQR